MFFPEGTDFAEGKEGAAKNYDKPKEGGKQIRVDKMAQQTLQLKR